MDCHLSELYRTQMAVSFFILLFYHSFDKTHTLRFLLCTHPNYFPHLYSKNVMESIPYFLKVHHFCCP